MKVVQDYEAPKLEVFGGVAGLTLDDGSGMTQIDPPS